jgi:4-amino-4-deoxy-L-arabinose transferase-like glycosyltransferase
MLARLSSAKLLFILAFTLYFLLLGHKLMRIGIHGDGLEYATVAMNMADDVGSFWKPYLDDHIHPVFHEHPPLVFWIQSIFFRIFGDGLYLESFYGALVGLVILGCMALFWQRVRSDFQLPPVGSWWPMLLMVSLPIFTYLMQTNRLSCTYVILAILPTYASYRSMIGERHLALFSLLSGVLIYLGFIAKGPVAFFTLAVPLIAWIALKAKFSRAVISTLLALGAFALALSAAFYFFPDSQDFWKGFWQAQVVASLKSERAAGDTHWYLVERWAAEMAVPVAVAGFFMILARISWRQVRGNRQALFFLLIGLASSLPFLTSTRQHSRYIFHSYPFYVLSLAFAADRIAAGIESVLSRRPRLRAAIVVIALGCFLAAFTSMLYGKDRIRRDRTAFYEDIYMQKMELPARITISTCPGAMILNDWLFADMMRVYKVSLTPQMGKKYLLIAKDSGCSVPEGYQRINREPTHKYMLYRKGPP